MKFNEIEGVDLCEDVAIYWVALLDVPEAVQNRAKEIDGVEYDALGFGTCVGYDFAKKEYFIFTDNDTVINANIYYVDKNGDRNWLRVDMGAEFTKQIFDACERINACIDTPRGYSIQKTAQFDRKFGLVLAKKDDAARPFTVWAFEETSKGYRDYGWSRGYADEKTAEKAFTEAVAVHTEHERTYHSCTVSATIWGRESAPPSRPSLRQQRRRRRRSPPSSSTRRTRGQDEI